MVRLLRQEGHEADDPPVPGRAKRVAQVAPVPADPLPPVRKRLVTRHPLEPAVTPFRAHIGQLAAEHGIQVLKQKHELNWRAQTVRTKTRGDRARHIYIGQLAGPTDYFSALHEIGHIVCGHRGHPPETPQCLRDEVEAWQWAFDHAKMQPPTRARHDISGFILTYIAAQKTRPSPDHPVWALRRVVEPDRTVAGPKGALP